MRATKTRVVTLALLAAGTVTASAQSVNQDPIVYFRVLSIFKETCAKEYGSLVKPEEDKALAAHAEDVMKFEIARVRAIKPTTPDAQARKAIEAHVEGVTKPMKAKFTGKCGADENTKLVNTAKTVADPARVAAIKKSIETGVPYDRARKASEAASAPLTFTTPQLQKQLLEGPLKGGKACAKQEVTGIALVSRTPKPVQGQPPHIRVQQQFVEDWTVSCDGEAKTHRITFTQDDRGVRGKHEVTEAKKK